MVFFGIILKAKNPTDFGIIETNRNRLKAIFLEIT